MNTSYAEIVLAGCILLLPFIYESSHVFRYRFKFFVYYATVIINSFILIPVFCLRPRNVKNLVIASSVCHHISTLIGLRWVLRGKEFLEKDHSYIIVSNHQSSIDILGMFDIWHIMNKCTVIAKKELLYVVPFGFAAWLCGLIFIDRTSHHSAQNTVNEAAETIKQNNVKLWIFPEGTRRNTGEIHPFKKGAFHMAVSSQLPILPVVYSRYYFLNKKEKIFDHGKVIITTLPPIPTVGMTVDDLDKLIEQTREIMTTTYHETTKEILESVGLSDAAYKN